MMWGELLANAHCFNEIVCFAGWRPWKIYRGANWLKTTFVAKSERKWEGKVSTGRSDKPREGFPTFVW
ncbi:MAG: hypothetical protein ACTS7D_01100 [Candidatus Hodgkinia cicadicola]